MAEGDLSDDWPFKLLLTVIILWLMAAGVVAEPGPISEIVGFAALGSVWGLDFGDVTGGGGS
jgi:hypothetical protein